MTQAIAPFGLLVTADPPGAGLVALDPHQLKAWAERERFVLLRGFAPPDLAALGERLGTVLEWEFGAINELQMRNDARNYLYTPREVPFHWDGAFVGRIPHWIVFHCVQAPPVGAGGETLLCDTVRLLALTPAARRAAWASVRITYSTEKIVHYGGTFTSPLIERYPGSDVLVLRYAEPVADLNPVHLDIQGVDDPASLVAEMRDALRDPRACYAHAWEAGDVLIADNFALLHGRRAFSAEAPRHLRRVNVL